MKTNFPNRGKKLLLIPLVLFAVLLCGTAFVACRFVPAEAHIYEDCNIRIVRLADTPSYLRELSDWIAHNNEQLYHATPVAYAPNVWLIFTGMQQSFDFLTDSVLSGTYIRAATEKDKQFSDWLMARCA